MYNENVLGKERERKKKRDKATLWLLRDCWRNINERQMLTLYNVFKRTARINCYNPDNDVVYYLKALDLLWHWEPVPRMK